ncbi:hypothetical protein Pmani_024899 [Petrolisthes manimaculis]|uniref:Kazrin N-terminal domain-containing protein n=1 Tax=Petrolisthes manimaculis TaxID=1843537 RepID=A0AAE1P8B5_9EUCA|nr:hypothetical protein Pmani_024899 [Petrolisthes manimaculis]
MGNSVGYYSLSQELSTERVSNPTRSDLKLLTKPEKCCVNVQRLSVTCLDTDWTIPPLTYLNACNSVDIKKNTSSSQTLNSEASTKSCPEVRETWKVCESRSHDLEHDVIYAEEALGLQEIDAWGQDEDSDTSSQPYMDTLQVIDSPREDGKMGNQAEHMVNSGNKSSSKPREWMDESTLQKVEPEEMPETNYIRSTTHAIECLIKELQENRGIPDENTSKVLLSLSSEDEELVFSDRPVVYTAKSADNWRLGTIPEESDRHYEVTESHPDIKDNKPKLDLEIRDSKPGPELEIRDKEPTLKLECKDIEPDLQLEFKDSKPRLVLERYNSSEDEEGVICGTAINVSDIDAERQKEEGIQLCLEPYEDKIHTIEECLLNSSESIKDLQRGGKETGSCGRGRRHSSADLSTVIEGNHHNITYLRFGSGLEDDVTSVVEAEYTKRDLNATGEPHDITAEDGGVVNEFVNEMVIVFNETATTCKNEQGVLPEGRKTIEGVVDHICTIQRRGSFKLSGESPYYNHKSCVGKELAKESEGMERTNNYYGGVADDKFHEASIEYTEVTERWRQLCVRRPSATGGSSCLNAGNADPSETSSNQLVEELSQLRLDNDRLCTRNRALLSEVEELRRVKENFVEEEDMHLKVNDMTTELTHAKEALSALKADRKRLKAEKFDLINQMKQLYATLEDKEKELRDFIRNYEQRMKESDESLRHLAAERDETEREKWNILKHARDESERVVKLSAQLGLKETALRKLQDEFESVRKQLTSVGYYSDAESVRTNGLPTPTASTPTCSPLPVATPTPTPNGRGSSADSGVRLCSDRDSTASHEGGPGTPKESPSLSPLYATPMCGGGGRGGGGGGQDDHTPTSTNHHHHQHQQQHQQHHSHHPPPPPPPPTSHHHHHSHITSTPLSGLANSGATSGGLSRSAEELCERLSEGHNSTNTTTTTNNNNNKSGRFSTSTTLSRKSHKSGGSGGGGTWGSISRVFARQKKRAALDTSIYDGVSSSEDLPSALNHDEAKHL